MAPLRLAVLVKQIPAFEAMELGPDGRLVRDGLELEMNAYCRRAVALGCTLAEATGGDSIAQGSKSFALASRLFDRETRERVWLLYAWCRAADDLIDGQDHGGAMTPGHDAKAAVARIRDLTDKAYRGEPTGEPAFDALGYLLTEVAIPRAVIDDIVAGFELDAADWRPRSEADLLRYSYHVAGAVGVAVGVGSVDVAVMLAALTFFTLSVLSPLKPHDRGEEDDPANRER